MARRLDALQKFKAHPGYNDFLMAVIRVRNRTPDEELPAIDEGLLKEEEEKALYRVFEGVRRSGKLASAAKYSEALDGLVELTGPVNTFFDHVLVMDKDEAVKRNRLALLGEIWALVSSVADFSKLSESA